MVHDYIDNLYPEADVLGNPRLKSKKNVMKVVRNAVSRKTDRTLLVKTYEIPEGIPWIEAQTVEFKVRY